MAVFVVRGSMGRGHGCEGCVKLVWLSGLPGGVFVLFLCVGVCPFRLVGSCCVFLFAGVDAATVRCFGRAAVAVRLASPFGARGVGQAMPLPALKAMAWPSHIII